MIIKERDVRKILLGIGAQLTELADRLDSDSRFTRISSFESKRSATNNPENISFERMLRAREAANEFRKKLGSAPKVEKTETAQAQILRRLTANLPGPGR